MHHILICYENMKTLVQENKQFNNFNTHRFKKLQSFRSNSTQNIASTTSIKQTEVTQALNTTTSSILLSGSFCLPVLYVEIVKPDDNTKNA